VKRLVGLAEAAARAVLEQEQEQMTCGLCSRPLGQRTEWHHIVPKSEGGTETTPLHPICHRAIHAFVANRELATTYATMDQLRTRDDIRRFLRWIADKPPNFRAPTRRQRLP
jgi:hypothetical protein